MSKAKKLLTYGVIVAIAIVCALNYELFVFPNRFAPAGLNGICTMIQYVFGINIGYMSLLINVPLALAVFFLVSKPLAIRSMVYVGTFSLVSIALDYVDLSRFVYYTESGTSAILGPLVAGIIAGSCYALLLQASAYTGGTDFVASIIHKYSPEKSIFYLIFIMNAAVAVASYFVYDYQIEPVILCILYSFTSSTVSERLTKNGRTAVRFEIITDYPEQISDAIIHQLHHSATLIPGRGMYLNKEVSMLFVIVNNNQVAKLTAICRQFPNTFAIIDPVSEVMGNFKKIDKSGRQEKAILDSADGKAV
ncbi:MAG: YitT family protein [Oscillospiraceae bacterium]|nr:YitT family protein [Oscillospiraceae bacterium]